MIKQVVKEIDDSKKYDFPEEIQVVEYKGKFIIIAVETGNWMVFNNYSQVNFFNLLKKHNIKDATHIAHCSNDDIVEVIKQIEAKGFENLEVLRSTMPLSLHFHLTNGCNMKCPMCYMVAGKKEEKELSTDEVINLLETFSAEGGKKVTFTGGEITTRKDLYQIVKCASKNLRVELLSNGTLWTDQMIEEFSPLIDKIQISIDGYSEATNARVRGNNNFSKALQTVDKFVHHNVYTEVAMTPYFDEEYRKNYLKYAEFGKKLTEKYSEFKFKVKFSGVLLDGRERSFSEAEKNEYNAIAEKIYESIFGNANDYQFINFHKNHGIQDVCNYGNLTITATGDIYFCPQIPELSKIANIRTTNVHDLIQLAKKAKVAANVDNIYPCRNCALKYICGGDCRIKYFPELRNFKEYLSGKMPHRDCDFSVKEKFYKLMIKYNTAIFQ